MYIKVQVIPKAKKEAVKKEADNFYIISVREPAERNLANLRIKSLVANIYQVSENKVKLVIGHHSRSKIFSVDEPLPER